MNGTVWIIGVVLVLITLLLATGWWRYVLTGYLIARVSPYEQVGTGAGRIHVIGDSTGYGTGARLASESVAGRLGADFPSYTITNDSSNGRRIEGAMGAVRDLDGQYDLILFQIGANDMLGGATAKQTVERMQSLVSAAQAHSAHIVIVTSGNIGGVPMFNQTEARRYTDTSRTYDELMKNLTQSMSNVSFVALFDEPEDDPFMAQPGFYTSIDGLHPTSAGYEIWYNKAKSAFDDVLNQ